MGFPAFLEEFRGRILSQLFSPAETHALLGIIFLNRYALALYAMAVPILVCSGAARVLRDRVGWFFCAGIALAGLVLLLKTGSDFSRGLFTNWMVFWFCLGLALFCHGLNLFFKYRRATPSPAPAPLQPRGLPSPYGETFAATADKINNAFRDKTQASGSVGQKKYKRQD